MYSQWPRSYGGYGSGHYGGYRAGLFYPTTPRTASTHAYRPPVAAPAYTAYQPVTRPPTPPPTPPADRNFLWAVFQRVDANGNGEIDMVELQNALSNGTWAPFNPETVRLLIGMFDPRQSGVVRFEEFAALWKYVVDWQRVFGRFDADRSGNIDRDELQRCLTAFGYRLSDGFYDTLITRFDRTRTGLLNFDDFVQLCVMMQTLTASFRDKDRRRKGRVLVTYEGFLTMVFNSRV